VVHTGLSSKKGRPAVSTHIYESAVVETQEFGSDKITRQKMVMCCHCGLHFLEPREGFFFCDSCVGPVCCSKNCRETCLHLEQWMENLEAGRPEDYKPSRIFVPFNYGLKGSG
jgi:hypothetical protein